MNTVYESTAVELFECSEEVGEMEQDRKLPLFTLAW